ncbi:MAG: phage portal protein, partial [Stellaceae bacterium]
YQQILHGMPAVDYTAADIVYRPRNVRVHKVYGFSPVEQILVTVNIALRRQVFQLQYYTEGNVPEAIVSTPAGWTVDQVQEFQAYWDGLYSGNTAERRHAKFVPDGVGKTFIPMKDGELTGATDEWLARLCCFAFSVSPQPFVRMMNRATAESAQATAEAEGLAPLKRWVKSLIDGVVADEFAAPDLEFRWRDDPTGAEAGAAQAAVDYVKCGIKSVNEVRSELGLDPVPGGELPTILTPQGPVALTSDAVVAKRHTGFVRFNPNHYGPGPQGGQFAPTGEDGASAGADGTEVAAGGGESEGEPGRGSIDGEFVDPTAPVRTQLYYAARTKLQAIDPENAAISSVETKDWVPSADDVNGIQDALDRVIEEHAAAAAAHAYDKHVLDQGEFPEIASQIELQSLAQNIMRRGAPMPAQRGRIFFYQRSTNTLVIVDPGNRSDDNIFRPDEGFDYVREHLKR